MFTPYKKRKAEAEDGSVDGSMCSYQDVAGPPYSPLKPETDYASQGITVVQNFDWLSKMALAAKKGNDEMEDTVSDVMMRLEARIGELKAVVGTRFGRGGNSHPF